MAVGLELSLDVSLLDSMLLRILGGSEGDDLGALFASQSKKAVFDKIDGEVVSDKRQFVAHKPRGKTGTAICTSLDGNIYDADDPSAPSIPQHFGCRSIWRFIKGLLSGN